MNKSYRFFYHFRKSTRGMTVHFKNTCLSCKNVVCKTECSTKWNSRQPRLVMQGFAKKVTVENDIAYIE